MNKTNLRKFTSFSLQYIFISYHKKLCPTPSCVPAAPLLFNKWRHAGDVKTIMVSAENDIKMLLPRRRFLKEMHYAKCLAVSWTS